MDDLMAELSATDNPASEKFPLIDISQIDSNPDQPRREFDPAAMKSLAESIGAHGLLQPVVVRRVNDRYELIAGERRLRAAIQAGWTEVPAHVIQADDRQVAEMSVIENLHRKDLNPLEKAVSFQRYLEQYGCTQEELAARLKIDRSTIANLIRLLELPEVVQQTIRLGKITQGHARALLPLGDEREQVEFCQRIQREGLNVRQTEALVQDTIHAADAEPLDVISINGKKSRSARAKNENTVALEQQLRAAIGLKVALTHNARGAGKLVIHFRNHEEFERLRSQLCDPGRPAAQSHAG
jgi:ParB family transcriptional regulator, chromosome partitioning protein